MQHETTTSLVRTHCRRLPRRTSPSDARPRHLRPKRAGCRRPANPGLLAPPATRHRPGQPPKGLNTPNPDCCGEPGKASNFRCRPGKRFPGTSGAMLPAELRLAAMTGFDAMANRAHRTVPIRADTNAAPPGTESKPIKKRPKPLFYYMPTLISPPNAARYGTSASTANRPRRPASPSVPTTSARCGTRVPGAAS